MSRILAMLVACASSSLALAPGPLPASHELRSSHAVGVGVARPPLTPRASEPLLVATSGEADPQYGLLKSFRFDELRISGRQGLPGGKIDAHYSSRYWLVSLMNTHRSLVLRRIRSQLVFNVLVTCLILGARTVGFRPAVPITMHTLLGGFVSLLLVFRTNSAYARFWEARIIWGGVKNTCIDIVLAICANVRPRAPQAAADLVSALQLYPGSLSCQCRAEPPDGNLDPYALCLRMHKAVALAAAEVDASGPDRRDSVGVRLFELQLSRLNGDIDKLADAAGACSRLRSEACSLTAAPRCRRESRRRLSASTSSFTADVRTCSLAASQTRQFRSRTRGTPRASSQSGWARSPLSWRARSARASLCLA